jgi:hypothetical protein
MSGEPGTGAGIIEIAVTVDQSYAPTPALVNSDFLAWYWTQVPVAVGHELVLNVL